MTKNIHPKMISFHEKFGDMLKELEAAYDYFSSQGDSDSQERARALEIAMDNASEFEKLVDKASATEKE